jgi:hypothetical protein
MIWLTHTLGVSLFLSSVDGNNTQPRGLFKIHIKIKSTATTRRGTFQYTDVPRCSFLVSLFAVFYREAHFGRGVGVEGSFLLLRCVRCVYVDPTFVSLASPPHILVELRHLRL